MAKVIVGMSGGVDSSVTVHLLKEQGYEVEGVSFILWEARCRRDFTACCSREATDSASKTAELLGIRHSSLDVRDLFIEKVIEPFVDSYIRGATPNPCILCNRHVKFPMLLREAEERGASHIATGHYASIGNPVPAISGAYCLRKGVDPSKDQSYVLYMLGQPELSRLLLPLGEYRKKDIRQIARSLNLPAADRPESQEICFVEDRDYARFIGELSPLAAQPGPVKDMTGREVGTHKGIYCYTMGQRKGLGISSLEPHYVVRIDARNNTLVVGCREDALVREVVVSDLLWTGRVFSDSFRATVKVRSMAKGRPASIAIEGTSARITFDEPQWAPAPGQSAVFYDGDTVLGGGVIVSPED
jgi:tRNA-specific 2-thiouridylase